MPFQISAEKADEIASTLRRRHRGLVWSEEVLLGLIASDTSKMDVYWSVIGLRHCGTEHSIPALKALASYPVQDVKAAAMSTIATIAGASETPYYADCLGDPKYRVKDYALWAIGEVGDARALDAVHAYIKRNKRQLSQPPQDCRVHLEIVAYFYRTLGPAHACSLLTESYDFITNALIRSPMMNAFVREKFLERIPSLAGAAWWTFA